MSEALWWFETGQKNGVKEETRLRSWLSGRPKVTSTTGRRNPVKTLISHLRGVGRCGNKASCVRVWGEVIRAAEFYPTCVEGVFFFDKTQTWQLNALIIWENTQNMNSSDFRLETSWNIALQYRILVSAILSLFTILLRPHFSPTLAGAQRQPDNSLREEKDQLIN